jgi:hypothetical protein
LQALPQAPAHSRFSGAGQADERDRHAVQQTPRINARRCGR